MGLAKRFSAEERGDKPIPENALVFFGLKPKKKQKKKSIQPVVQSSGTLFVEE